MMKNSGRKKVIYAIKDSNNLIGYIGQTCEFERRKFRHLNPMFRKPRNVDKWISSLKSKPTFTVLEECDWYDATIKEIHWKKQLKPVVRD